MLLVGIGSKSTRLSSTRAVSALVNSHNLSTTRNVSTKKPKNHVPPQFELYEFSQKGKYALAKLGIVHPQRIVTQELWNVLSAIKSNTRPRVWANINRRPDAPNYREEDPELLKDPQVWREVYAEMGFQALSHENLKNKFYQTAVFCLATAMELGHRGATMRLWQIEQARDEQYEPSSKMMSLFKEATDQRTSWEPMSVYLHSQLLQVRKTPQTREANYQIAKDLLLMVQPGTVGIAQPGFAIPKQPWKLLYLAAVQYNQILPDGPEKDEVAATFDEAIRIGAEEFRDPEAVGLYADTKSIELHSQKWLDLKTQSAMSGDADDCKLVGKYWLEKTGWYPPKGSVPQHDYAQLGFEWMELAATLPIDNVEAMYDRSMLLALLLRENGQKERGRSYIENAIIVIDANALHTADAERRIADLKEFAKHWNVQLGATAASAWAKVG